MDAIYVKWYNITKLTVRNFSDITLYIYSIYMYSKIQTYCAIKMKLMQCLSI